MRADIKPGAAFPDYELPDHTGRQRRLSKIQGQDPMVIVLAREAYSATDQVQHEGLVQLWGEMKPGVGYCRTVTITTTDPRSAQLPKRRRGGMAVPRRPRQDRAARPGNRRVHRPGHNQMVPHTIVCEPGLIVYKVYNGYWFSGAQRSRS